MAKDKPCNYGGQALMEGVMMQGNGGYSMAVRTPQGDIVYKNGKRKSLKDNHKWARLPLIRGLISFGESMYIGFSALTWSAAQAGEEEDEKLSTKELIFAMLSALVISILFFVALPVFVASFSLEYLGYFGRSLIEGLLRIGIFLAYVLAIRRIPDVARVFEYHGAEHKTISTLEGDELLTPENSHKYSTIHCRCGTSFILMSMIMMVIIFTFVGNTTVLARMGIKILMMPIVFGIAFEVFRLPLKFPNSKIVKFLITPGLWMQKLTTKAPNDKEMEVAIAAMLTIPGFEKLGDNVMPPRVYPVEEYEGVLAKRKAEQEGLSEH